MSCPCLCCGQMHSPDRGIKDDTLALLSVVPVSTAVPARVARQLLGLETAALEGCLVVVESVSNLSTLSHL